MFIIININDDVTNFTLTNFEQKWSKSLRLRIFSLDWKKYLVLIISIIFLKGKKGKTEMALIHPGVIFFFQISTSSSERPHELKVNELALCPVRPSLPPHESHYIWLLKFLAPIITWDILKAHQIFLLWEVQELTDAHLPFRCSELPGSLKLGVLLPCNSCRAAEDSFSGLVCLCPGVAVYSVPSRCESSSAWSAAPQASGAGCKLSWRLPRQSSDGFELTSSSAWNTRHLNAVELSHPGACALLFCLSFLLISAVSNVSAAGSAQSTASKSLPFPPGTRKD